MILDDLFIDMLAIGSVLALVAIMLFCALQDGGKK